MFTEMRKKDRQLAKEEIEAILIKAKYGVLSTKGVNGYPYGVPISFVCLNGNIYFHCAADVGNKVENIKNDPKVSFTVIGDTEVLPDKFSTNYESIIAFGEAAEVSDREKQTILQHVIQKYSQGFEESGIKFIEKLYEKVAVYEIKISYNRQGKEVTGFLAKLLLFIPLLLI